MADRRRGFRRPVAILRHSVPALVIVLVAAAPPGRAAGASSAVTVVAPATIDEGSAMSVDATYDGSMGSPDGPVKIVWGDGEEDKTDAGGSAPYAVNADHTFADDGDVVVKVRYRIGGSWYAGKAQVTVENVPPALDPLPDSFAPTGESFSVPVSFSDPGADDHTATIDWGDGSAVDVVPIESGDTISHIYASDITTTASVTVDDGDGGSDTRSFGVTAGPACFGRPITADLTTLGVTTYVGTPGDDVVMGTNGDDTIRTKGGDDAVCAGGGNDTVATGSGSDQVDGGAGDDTIRGGSGDDDLIGGGRDDIIVGGAGDDTIDGGTGSDHLDGGPGSDLITGGTGDDEIHGRSGADALGGGRGTDTLAGGKDGDVLHGGSGADVLRGGSGKDFLFPSERPSLDDMKGGKGADIVGLGMRGIDGSIRRRLTQSEALAFQGAAEISEFTTYHPVGQARVINIQTMADAVDGYVVMPGEWFSLNDVVGPRTSAKGYVLAGAIIGGYVQCCDNSANIGGGTSQFATTFYNAIFFSGLEDVPVSLRARPPNVANSPHTLYFSRYPAGREATMGYPANDVRFRNDTDTAVLVVTEHGPAATANHITVRLYGDTGGRTVEAIHSCRPPGSATIFPEVNAPSAYCPTYTWTTKVYVPNSSFPPSRMDVTPSQPGFSITVTRVIHWPNGSTTEVPFHWRYDAGFVIIETHPCNIPPGYDGYTGEACPTDGGDDGGGGGFDPQ